MGLRPPTKGFKRKNKAYRLKFVDSDLDGLEIVMRSVSTGRILELQEMATVTNAAIAAAQDGTDGGTSVDPAMVRKMVEMVAGAMISWNLEDDDDVPVPITVEGLLDQEIDFLMQIVMAWTEAIAGVAAPLEPGSTSGVNALEASLPMETLSSSLAS
jgi:hypothetical protein